jgi:hypothetical protein
VSVVKVVQRGRYRIYVYVELGGPHHHPHCHVYWPDGSAAVELDSGRVLKGHDLPAEARRLFEEYQTLLENAWKDLNEHD